MCPAAAFFLLCLANLAAIEKWEWAELRLGAEPPHVTTRAMVRTARIWVPLFAVAALLRGRDPWYLAIGISAALTGVLLFVGGRLRIEARRVLVDAVLLTPLSFSSTRGWGTDGSDCLYLPALPRVRPWTQCLGPGVETVW